MERRAKELWASHLLQPGLGLLQAGDGVIDGPPTIARPRLGDLTGARGKHGSAAQRPQSVLGSASTVAHLVVHAVHSIDGYFPLPAGLLEALKRHLRGRQEPSGCAWRPPCARGPQLAVPAAQRAQRSDSVRCEASRGLCAPRRGRETQSLDVATPGPHLDQRGVNKLPALLVLRHVAQISMHGFSTIQRALFCP